MHFLIGTQTIALGYLLKLVSTVIQHIASHLLGVYRLGVSALLLVLLVQRDFLVQI
jgi:hypothetical protein